MIVSPSDISYAEFYSILLNSVGPRPIAWVSTISEAGKPNLAPFSFFNAICTNPPLLGFSPALRQAKPSGAMQGEAKDTLRNIRETKEFVVNVVTYDLREAMNLSAGDYDPSINEFELAKLTPEPSKIIRPPRVAESPVSFECQLYQILDFSTAPNGGSFVIGKILSVYMNDNVMKNGKLDRNALDLIGRMGGMQYATTRERFEMMRPKVG
jgi:flavin reductase (DIM6/NTAB) family NADH-FMN oxidoreductase RutF